MKTIATNRRAATLALRIARSVRVLLNGMLNDEKFDMRNFLRLRTALDELARHGLLDEGLNARTVLGLRAKCRRVPGDK